MNQIVKQLFCGAYKHEDQKYSNKNAIAWANNRMMCGKRVQDKKNERGGAYRDSGLILDIQAN